MNNIEAINNELKETKNGMTKSLNSYLGNIETTKEELIKYREELTNSFKERGIEENKYKPIVERETNTFNIQKKLNAVIREASQHEQIDYAIAFLDKVLSGVKE